MVDAWSYTTALHEFGHVRGYAGGGDTLMSEAAAWEWALGVCVVWAPESHQNLREALQSYMRQRGRARHVPGTMACERVIERSAAMVKTRSRSLDVAMRRFRRSVFERTHGPTAVCGGPRHYYSRPPATEDVDGKPLCAACADDAWTDQTFQRLKRERFDWEHAELQRQLTLREALAHGR
jgi:alkanesulfonate monooxygenase SsuD/methylene tetrahydromethanopterin reductase-like flavin-dependent oxidoreductase (luciferase family)